MKAGVISPSMPVAIVDNPKHGNRSFTNLNEGLGKVLRMGAFDAEVQKRLQWMKATLAPSLRKGLKKMGPVDLKAVLSQALHMGDEGHNRNVAATSLFTRMLTPHLIRELPTENAAEVADFLKNNNHFFLNLSMAACKVMLDSAHNVEGSTLVTVMARNGVEFGIKMSGTGNKWFTDVATVPKGLFFPGYKESDANPDIGDSNSFLIK
jgi:hypothetical protein